jgi:hypothetical protein
LIYLFISKALRKECPTMFPKSGAPMEIDACLQSLFYLSFRVPSKGTLPPSFLHRVPIEIDAPSPEAVSTIYQSSR